MEIEERVAALERRLAELVDRPAASAAGPSEETFWALAELRRRHACAGGVAFAGSVRLADDRALEWQEELTTDAVLAQDWRVAADVLGALGHPVRLALLQRFLSGAATVAEASTPDERGAFGTTGQIYHHLRQLVAAGWLQGTGGGRYVVPPQRVIPLLSIVMGAHR
jgi:hypothetical protein